MNKITVEYYNTDNEVVNEVFEDVVGQQVSGSVIQIIMSNGTQRIISGFCTVDVTPDEEGMKKALELSEQAYGPKETPEVESKVTPIK